MRRPNAACLLLTLLLLVVSGCTLFKEPPLINHSEGTGQVWSIDQPQEYWTGLELNGERIGFSHFSILPQENDLLLIESELALAFRSFGVAKQVSLKNRDWVRKDLSLVRFEHEQTIDGNQRRISGTVAANRLVAEVRQLNQMGKFETDVNPGLRPSSAMLLSSFLDGLIPEREAQFEIFDSEVLKVVSVRQTVGEPESSSEFSGLAYRVSSELDGAPGTSWMYPDGRPALETSLDGAIVSRLESESKAKEYLASAVLNKRDVLLDFSRVPIKGQIADPERLSRLKIRIHGIPDDFPALEADALQRCEVKKSAWVCEMTRGKKHLPVATDLATQKKFLTPSLVAPSEHLSITQLARQIAGDSQQDQEKVQRIVTWMDQHIGKRAVDSFSALDVLQSGEAECQGHSYLYTALARAMQIPTRVVNGLVYLPGSASLLFHTWVESHLDGAWVPVDPTFGQVPADATHVKLVVGEQSAELAPLIRLIGRLDAEVLESDSR